MEHKIEQRLQSLKDEYQSGQTVLDELETKQRNVEETMLRISGAIQVLEELLEAPPSEISEGQERQDGDKMDVPRVHAVNP
ncbi:hypothetical protein ACFL2V_00020 [Pseudomonadota bacterium]